MVDQIQNSRRKAAISSNEAKVKVSKESRWLRAIVR